MQKTTFPFIAFFSFLFFSLLSHFSSSQILINEISSANDATIADEDGDYEDWIELYNTSNSTINLDKYAFVYEETNETPITWIFPPKASIKPKTHMLVFASEKDRKDVIHHWEVPIFADSIWKYKANTTAPPDTDWYQPAYNDISWAQGLGGFGYGDGDDQTNTGAALSVYIRKNFFVADTSKYPLGLLMIDYDDAFVAYLNGVEVARSNIGAYGDHPAYDISAYEEHEAQFYQGGSAEFFLVQLKNNLKPGNNVFCVQVHNFSGGLDDLTLMPWLIMGNKDTTPVFPSFPADFFMHTNFSLSNSDGFKLTLKDSLGLIKDSLSLAAKNMHPNNSKGRSPDGANKWCYFWGPTPNDTNDITQCFGGYVQKPTFNLPSGFYSGTQTLSINVPPGTYVYYTRNGDNPDWFDPMYTNPIIIDSTQVIRARAFSSTGSDLPSNTITNSYFINETISLPVISLCTDSVNLWDWNTGIYVMGPNADTNLPYQNANFWMPWKKQAHTEYFDKNKVLGFEQDCATEIHGNFSRAWPQKSFRIMANDDYQNKYINYQLFPEKNITKFRSFNIRNAGIDWNTCHFRDRLFHKLVQQKTDIDMMDGESCVLFLNGQYWGVYEMRERQDEYYIAENHNVNKDSIDLLRFEGDILEGSNEAFYNMVAFMYFNDLSIQANYDSAMKLIELKNYCDYFSTETFINNRDWIWIDNINKSESTNNIKFWRNTNPPSAWRYILWDTDLGGALFDGVQQNCENDYLANIIDSSILFPSYHVVMLRSLLKNTSFKNYFINRYCDLMNTIFYPYNVVNKIQSIRNEMLPDMPRQFSRWAGPMNIFGIWTVGRSVDIPTWQNEIDTLESFAYCRPYSVRDSMQQLFSLTKQVDVTMNVSPAGAGNIKLNTITKLDSLPWAGVYFDGVPITMTATANTGYKFSHWQSPTVIPNPNTSSSVTINVTASETFTAYFQKLEMAFSVFPNPFSNNFTMNFELPSDMQVSVKMYNVLGQEVAKIISPDNLQKAGTYQLKVDTEKYPLASGVYFLNFKAGEFSQLAKMVKTND